MCPFMLSINMIPTLVAYTTNVFHMTNMIPKLVAYHVFIDKYDTDAGRIYGQMCPFMLSINMIPTLVAYTVKCALSCYR